MTAYGAPPEEEVPEWFSALHDDRGAADHSEETKPDSEPPPVDDLAKEYGQAGFAEPVDILGNADMVGHPELTPDCLPSVLYDHATAEGERMLADPVAIAAHCISAASLMASDAWRIKPKLHDHWTQNARVWSCVIKPPGARGTDMLRAAYRPIEQIADEQRREYEREHAAWREGIEGLKGEDVKEAKKNEPKQMRVLTSDATVEALSELLKDKGKYGKIGYYADELTTFFDFGRYSKGKGGGGARAAMLQAYDGGGQQIDRVMRGSVYVQNWSAVAAGNIQPRKLAEMGIELASDGLFQRFMVVHAKSAPLHETDDNPLNPRPFAVYRDALHELYRMRPPEDAAGQRIQCYLEESGRKVRERLLQLIQRLQHDHTLPELIRETAGKWSGLFARLTLIFHLIELAERRVAGDDPPISEVARVPTATAEKAAAFVRRILLPNLFRLGFESLPDGNELSHARWIAGHLLAHRLDYITASQIGRANRKLRGMGQDISLAMDVLTHAGWALQAEARVDGLRWKVNPVVHERFAKAGAEERAERAKVRDLIRRKVSEL